MGFRSGIEHRFRAVTEVPGRGNTWEMQIGERLVSVRREIPLIVGKGTAGSRDSRYT